MSEMRKRKMLMSRWYQKQNSRRNVGELFIGYFFGWLIELFLWLFLTVPMLIIAIFKPKKL